MSIALGDGNHVASAPADRKIRGQQANVYAAESRIAHGRWFDSIEEVQAFVDSLTASDWWFAPHVVRVEVSRLVSKNWAGVGCTDDEHNAGTIALTKNGQNELTVLHEVAHTITHKGGGHGPVWVRNYLKLVYYVLGSDHYQRLYSSMQAHGVLFD